MAEDPCIHGPGVENCGHPDCVGFREFFAPAEPEKEPPTGWQKALGIFGAAVFIVVAAIVLAVLLAAVGGVIARGVRWGLEGW